VVAPDQLRAAALRVATAVAANSPTAMRATKRALWHSLEVGLTDARRAGMDFAVSMQNHPDQTEGPRAFLEKRRPHWQPLAGTATVEAM
jgi:enoyl-CoA hydratase/carnithine racemase